MTAHSDLVSRFPGRTVIVVGDLMLDHFVTGSVDRISPEAPVPVVRFEHETWRLGGAANVAHNAVALGARVEVIGLTGTDDAAATLRAGLERLGIGSAGFVEDDARRTTRKLRVVTTRNQQVARIDYEDDREVHGDVEAALVRRIDQLSSSADALVISDYLKGVISRVSPPPRPPHGDEAFRYWSIRRFRTSTTTRARRSSRQTITKQRPSPTCGSGAARTHWRRPGDSASVRAVTACSSREANTA